MYWCRMKGNEMSSGLLKPPSSRHKCRINPDMPKVLTWPLISVASWCKFVLLHLLKYPIYKQCWYHYVALLWLHSDIRLIKPFCAESDPSFFFLNCGFLIVPCTFALFSDMSWVVKGVWNSPQYLKQTFFMFIVQKTTNVIPFFEVCQTCHTQAMEAGSSDSHAHNVQVVLPLACWRISTNRCCFSLLHSSWTLLLWRLINPDIIQMEDITYISKLTLLTWRNARVSKRPNVLHYAGHIAMPNST